LRSSSTGIYGGLTRTYFLGTPRAQSTEI
jgi:hypothetical protein